MTISIVLPIHNEIRHGYLERILENLAGLNFVEIIVVDSGSQDGSRELVQRRRECRLVTVPPTHRAGRIEAGLKLATGDMLFLHHPRSLPDRNVFRWLVDHGQDLGWGALTHRFDQDHPILRFTSWYSNRIRGDRRGIFYLDHCLFVSRKLWSREKVFPQQEIFEDTAFSLMMRKVEAPRRLPFVSLTSATRFQQNGLYWQSLLLQATKLAFHMGISPERINWFYEKGLQFNNLASKRGNG